MPNSARTLVLLVMFATLTFASPVSAGRGGSQLSGASESMMMPTTIPLFIENQHFTSSLAVVYQGKTPGVVTLSLLDRSGNKLAMKSVSLAPDSNTTISIRELLREAGLSSAIGSIQITTPNMNGVLEQLSMSYADSEGNNTSFLDEEPYMPATKSSTEVRAVLPADEASVIAVSSISEMAQNVTLLCTSSGKADRVVRVLEPMKTMLLNACDMGLETQREITIEDLDTPGNAPRRSCGNPS